MHILLFVCSLINLFIPLEASNYATGAKELIGDFLDDPVKLNRFLSGFRTSGGFPTNLSPSDRDFYIILAFNFQQASFTENTFIYFGMENGHLSGISKFRGLYREPGESGYDPFETNIPEAKYLNTCVNKFDGSVEPCIMKENMDYIRCIDDCALQRCKDAESQRNCSQLTNDTERTSCESKIKWCPNYSHEKVPANKTLGFIPFTTYCINSMGHITDIDDQVLKAEGQSDGCYFEDGVTKVDRQIYGNFANCGGNGIFCNNTYRGGYQSINYDPRWRSWYEETKASQKSMWSDPYPFFADLDIGITFSTPLYSVEDSKTIFTGVLGVDYKFDLISEFLSKTYAKDELISVLIFEDKDPHYTIGSSIEVKTARKVLAKDESIPCPKDGEEARDSGCIAIRTKASEIDGEVDELNSILGKAFKKQKTAGFPDSEFIYVKGSENAFSSRAYFSETFDYEQEDAILKWRIMIVTPIEVSKENDISKQDIIFTLVIIMSGVGSLVCIGFFLAFWQKKKSRSVINSDWRFTCAFMLGCAALNLASLTLIGASSDTSCLVRMWSFHGFFVVALAPLLVKTWRIHRLIGERTLRKVRRVKITNKKAATITLVIIFAQVTILIFFTFLDPPKVTETISLSAENIPVQFITCESNSNIFAIMVGLFESSLVLMGCILAWKTRNLDSQFSETKQLIVAMYNIAFIATGILLITNLVDIKQKGAFVIRVFGVLWCSVFGSATFAIPRLLQGSQDSRRESRASMIRFESRENLNNNTTQLSVSVQKSNTSQQ